MLENVENLEERLCPFCPCTDFGSREANTGPYALCEGSHCSEAYDGYTEDYYETKKQEMDDIMKDKKIIFSNKTTVVIWDDDTKTIVKCSDGDVFDKDKGFLMAYFQKSTGMSKTEVAKFFNELKNPKRTQK